MEQKANQLVPNRDNEHDIKMTGHKLEGRDRKVCLLDKTNILAITFTMEEDGKWSAQAISRTAMGWAISKENDNRESKRQIGWFLLGQ